MRYRNDTIEKRIARCQRRVCGACDAIAWHEKRRARYMKALKGLCNARRSK